VDKLLRNLSNDRSEDIGWCELVNGLSEGHEDEGDLELVVGEVFDNVGVEAENTEFVSAHDSGKELHDENFVVERVVLVYGSASF